MRLNFGTVASCIAAIGVVAAGVVAQGKLLETASDDAAPQPGIWVATAGPTAEQAADPGAPWSIRLFDIVSGRRFAVGDPGFYVDVAFSPDGSRLAAIALELSPDSVSGAVEIWTNRGEAIARVPFTGFADVPNRLAWSPDGSRLAAIGPGGVTILGRSGERLGHGRLTPLADGSFSGRETKDLDPWAPDSQHLAVYANELLLVVNRNGAGREIDVPAAITRPVGEEPRSAFFAGWTGAGEVRLVAIGPGSAATTVGTVGTGPAVAWGPPAPFDRASLPPDPAMLERITALVPGYGVAGLQPTAEHSASVFALREDASDSQRTSRFMLAVQLQAQTVLIDLGAAGFAGRRPPPFDVVVVAGWSGSVPSRFDGTAAVAISPPAVRPWPTATPDELAPTDVALTPIPYPSPRGGRVAPQVAGLPPYPGAAEIDGFAEEINSIPAGVQMFATTDSEQQVVDFFDEQLTVAGFLMTSRSEGVPGQQRGYLRGRDRVLVSTAYIPRPGSERGKSELPYGFRANGQRFIDRVDGNTWFFLVTIHAR